MENQCGVKLEDASNSKKNTPKTDTQKSVKKEIEKQEESSGIDVLERIRRFSKFCRGGIIKCQKEEDFQEEQVSEE